MTCYFWFRTGSEVQGYSTELRQQQHTPMMAHASEPTALSRAVSHCQSTMHTSRFPWQRISGTAVCVDGQGRPGQAGMHGCLAACRGWVDEKGCWAEAVAVAFPIPAHSWRNIKCLPDISWKCRWVLEIYEVKTSSRVVRNHFIFAWLTDYGNIYWLCCRPLNGISRTPQECIITLLFLFLEEDKRIFVAESHLLIRCMGSIC